MAERFCSFYYMSDFFQRRPSLVEVLTDVWYEQPIIKSHDDIRKRKVYLDLYKQPILLLRWIFQNVIIFKSLPNHFPKMQKLKYFQT